MKIAIVYDSRTGTTRGASIAMGRLFEEHGHECTVQSVSEADPDQVTGADLVCIGSWTQGLFLILQHPTRATLDFIDRLGDLTGKQAIAFCTYKLATGSLLPRMAAALEAKGAEVLGTYRYRGAVPGQDFVRLAATVAASASTG